MRLEIPRPEHVRLAELAADLRAVDAATSGDWVGVPSILRRVATELAKSVPAGTGAIMGAGPRGEAIAVAVSLATGIPLLGSSTAPAVARQRITVVASSPTATDDSGFPDADVLSRLSVYRDDAQPDWRSVLAGARAESIERRDMSGVEAKLAAGRVIVGDGDRQWVDLGADPGAAAVLARHIADALSTHEVTAIVTWEQVEDVVFGQLVAAALGVQRFVVEEAAGLLGSSRAIPAGSRVGWASVESTGRLRRGAAIKLIGGLGSHLVAFADLAEVGTP